MASHLTRMWRRITHYYIPHFWHRLCGDILTEKGQRFVEYCARICIDPEYKPRTYEEMMFDEKIDKGNRKEMATRYLMALAPYLDLNFGDDDGTTE